jgi:hypothetical protein
MEYFPEQNDPIYFMDTAEGNLFGDLESYVHQKDENAVLVYLNVGNQLNAFSCVDHSKDIIVILVGTFQNIVRDAKIITQHREFFIRFPDQDVFPFTKAKIEELHKLQEALFPQFSYQDKIQLNMADESEDYERFLLTDLIAEIAFRFIALHEIGHHKEGHLSKTPCAFLAAVEYIKADEHSQSQEALGKRRKMELDADLYAILELAEEFHVYKDRFLDIFSETNDLEIFQLMAASIMLSILAMPNDGITIENMDTAEYFKKEYRLVVGFVAFAVKFYNSKEIRYAMLKGYCENRKLRKLFKEDCPKQKIKDQNDQLTNEAWQFYIYQILATMISVYCETKGVKTTGVFETFIEFWDVYDKSQ